MHSVIRHLFTGRDNKTTDIGRVLLFMTTVAYIGLTIYSMAKGGTFDPLTWGSGIGSIFGGGGALLWMKADTEPFGQEVTVHSGNATIKTQHGKIERDDDDLSDLSDDDDTRDSLQGRDTERSNGK